MNVLAEIGKGAQIAILALIAVLAAGLLVTVVAAVDLLLTKLRRADAPISGERHDDSRFHEASYGGAHPGRGGEPNNTPSGL